MKHNRFVVLLAALLACVLIFAACGTTKDDGKGNGPVVSPTTDPETNPETTPGTDAVTDGETEAGTDSTADKQAFYENYFGPDMEFAGEGMIVKIESPDAKMTLTTADNNFEMFIGDCGLGVYVKDGMIYLHTVLADDETEELQEQWFKTTNREGELDDLTGELTTTDFDYSEIKSVEYIETKKIEEQTYDLVRVITVTPAEESESLLEDVDDSFLDEEEESVETNAKEIIDEPEMIESEYTFYITADTHIVVKLISVTEEEVAGENDEMVTQTVTAECAFFEPEEFVLPEGVAVEEIEHEDFETTFGFVLLAVMLGAMAD